MPDYQLLIIGGGPAGYIAALRAARLGLKVGVVERESVGGICLRAGCVPTKTILRSTEVLHLALTADGYGIQTAKAEARWAAIRQRKDRIVALLKRGIEGLFKRRGVELIVGRGLLRDPHTIEVQYPDGGTGALTAEKVLLATGSTPVEPKGVSFDGRLVLTSADALRLERLPTSILIAGGGYIGCEFACLFAELGVRVTLVEMLEDLLSGMDRDLSRFALRILKRKGVTVLLKTRLEKLERREDSIAAELSPGPTVEAEAALVALGRRPASEDLGLEALDIRTDRRGAVLTDEVGRTSQPGVYAAGDLTGRMMLAHVAARQGLIAAEDAAGGSPQPINYHQVPAVVFLHPELASVGLSEEEARRSGRRVRTVSFPQQILGRDQAEGQPGGFVKLVAEEGTGQILGLHIAGHRAGDIIHLAALAMSSELIVEDLARAIYAHPTFSEGLMEAAEAWLGRGIHLD